jgi:Rhodopirellula transposase DDE domain
VCHCPPGTSKWNKIEHRLFSHISMNWRGRVLESREVVVNLIAGTTTRTGLTVPAELDHGVYQKGIKVTDHEMKQLPLVRHEFHGDWNYTIKKSMGEPDRKSTSPYHRFYYWGRGFLTFHARVARRGRHALSPNF